MYPSSGNCKPCVYPCLTCHSSTNCITCGGIPGNRYAAPNCKCLPGFYNRVDKCVKCELPCLTCTSPTNCLSRDDCDRNISGNYVSGMDCYKC